MEKRGGGKDGVIHHSLRLCQLKVGSPLFGDKILLTEDLSHVSASIRQLLHHVEACRGVGLHLAEKMLL